MEKQGELNQLSDRALSSGPSQVPHDTGTSESGTAGLDLLKGRTTDSPRAQIVVFTNLPPIDSHLDMQYVPSQNAPTDHLEQIAGSKTRWFTTTRQEEAHKLSDCMFTDTLDPTAEQAGGADGVAEAGGEDGVPEEDVSCTLGAVTVLLPPLPPLLLPLLPPPLLPPLPPPDDPFAETTTKPQR